MRKLLALAGVALAPLALVSAMALPNVGILLLTFFTAPIILPPTFFLQLILPIFVVGILGLLGTTPSDSILFIL